MQPSTVLAHHLCDADLLDLNGLGDLLSTFFFRKTYMQDTIAIMSGNAVGIHGLVQAKTAGKGLGPVLAAHIAFVFVFFLVLFFVFIKYGQ
jgi:hypothetical protein